MCFLFTHPSSVNMLSIGTPVSFLPVNSRFKSELEAFRETVTLIFELMHQGGCDEVSQILAAAVMGRESS